MAMFHFTVRQRAMAMAGLAPLAMFGCAIHEGAFVSAALPPAAHAAAPVAPAPVVPKAPAPDALVANIDMVTRDFDGIVGVAVRSIDDGWAVDRGAAMRRLPQQSVSKLWVAMTLLDKIDQGRIELDQPITITKADFTLFHQPVAALVKDENGYDTTVREVLHRALTMSDNTCNDKLLRLVGGPAAVRDFIARKQLGAIRFGPGEKLLQSGTAGLQWSPEFSFGRAFEVARARLPRDVREAAFESYVADPPDGAAPSAIADALVRLKKGALLSPSSTAYLLQTMSESHTGRQRLRGAVPRDWEFGHKTGTGQDLYGRTAGYNDVGILTAPDGKSYSVAVMIGDTPKPIRDRQALMQAVVAAIVANHG